MKNAERYHHFSVQEFILDADFIRYVKSNNERDILFWQNWCKNNPNKVDMIDEAKIIVSLMQEHGVSSGDSTKIWQGLRQRHKDVISLQKVERNARIYKNILIASVDSESKRGETHEGIIVEFGPFFEHPTSNNLDVA